MNFSKLRRISYQLSTIIFLGFFVVGYANADKTTHKRVLSTSQYCPSCTAPQQCYEKKKCPIHNEVTKQCQGWYQEGSNENAFVCG
jgi:nitrate/TMAO reductase-like tetraheme cytochrome c subunit